MLKDISSIGIKGACFNNMTKLNLLNPYDGGKLKLAKGAILYGRNGVGKSTIAKAIKKLKNGEYSYIEQVEILDKDGNNINIAEDEKRQIYVFDEEFIDNNVKFQESGLNTIVMLGEYADLASQIQQAVTELVNAQHEYETLSENFERDYNNRLSVKAPNYYIDKIKLALQGDDNWAGRERLIKGGRNNASVREDTYKQFLSLKPTESRDSLVVLFNEKMKELQKAKNGDAVINIKVPSIVMQYADEQIAKLLAVKIEEPVLSERERMLLDLVQNGKSEILTKMITVFGDKETKSCPFCLQPVNAEHKNDLVASVQKVLSKIVEEHQEELKKYIVNEIKIDLSMYAKLGAKQLDCYELIDKINHIIVENNRRLLAKIADPYSPIICQEEKIETLLERLIAALKDLEDERIRYNAQIKDTTPIIRELNRINNEIAYYDILEFSKKYSEQEREYRVIELKKIEKQNVFFQKKNLVEELEARKRNIRIALTIINNSLKYIFFSADRLKIVYQDNAYVLLSNGHAVKPSQVSLGERNIIALCYFFANIMQNQEVRTIYDKEYFLVIDDPVSSFDLENKVGIMSFLKYQLGKYLLGNKNTRAIVMTHDLLTFYDLNKMFEEMVEDCTDKFTEEKIKFNRWELNKKELKVFEYKHRQEYSELMRIIYSYIKDSAEEYELLIGNMLRQVLEAFSTFQYKKNIEKVSTDQNILNLLPEEVYRLYFNNLMYRLILHGGSHREDQVKALDDLNFFSIVSKEEKKRTAKDILCFLYLLNKRHVLAHLQGCGNDVDINLQKWCEDIKTRSVDETI